MLAYLIPALFSAGYFLRGRNWHDLFRQDWIPEKGTLKNRLFWALVVAIPTILHYDLSLAVAAPLLFTGYAGNAWVGHGAHQSAYVWIDQKPGDGQWTEWPTIWLPYVLPRTRTTLPYYNWIGLTVVAATSLLITATPLAVFVSPHWWWLPVFGTLRPLAYWWGWWMTEDGRDGDPLHYAEAAWGFFFGLGWLVFLLV